jgi:hypothetical protein
MIMLTYSQLWSLHCETVWRAEHPRQLRALRAPPVGIPGDSRTTDDDIQVVVRLLSSRPWRSPVSSGPDNHANVFHSYKVCFEI